MKNMKKNDGYIMVYVLVVVLVVSMVAVAACTAAIRNFKAQSAAVSYSQDKYVAQGVVELFMAGLKDAAVEVAQEVADDVKENKEEIKSETTYGNPMELTTFVGSEDYIKLSIQDGIDDAVNNILSAGLDMDVDGTPITFRNYTYQRKNEISGLYETFEDEDKGYFEMIVSVSAHYGQARIDTEITFGFEASVETDNANKYYELSDVFFRYTSHEVTPTTGR